MDGSGTCFNLEVIHSFAVSTDSLCTNTDFSGHDIAGLQRGGPASKAGARVGDIIIEINGQVTTNRRTVMNLIAQIAPGEKLKIKVLRAGKTVELKATVGERPRANSRSGQRG